MFDVPSCPAWNYGGSRPNAAIWALTNWARTVKGPKISNAATRKPIGPMPNTSDDRPFGAETRAAMGQDFPSPPSALITAFWRCLRSINQFAMRIQKRSSRPIRGDWKRNRRRPGESPNNNRKRDSFGLPSIIPMPRGLQSITANSGLIA